MTDAAVDVREPGGGAVTTSFSIALFRHGHPFDLYLDTKEVS